MRRGVAWLLTLLLLASVSLRGQNGIDPLHGLWRDAHNSQRYWCFYSNGSCKEQRAGGMVYSRYRFEQRGDTCLWATSYLGHDEHYYVAFRGDTMAYYSVKSRINRSDLVHEYGMAVRDCGFGPAPLRVARYAPSPPLRIVLPKGFRGMAVVEFDNPSGAYLRPNARGELLLNVPKNGVLRVRNPIDAFAIAFRDYRVFEEGKPLPELIAPYWHSPPSNATQLAPSDRTVRVFGLNVASRNQLRAKHGEKFDGNVLLVGCDRADKLSVGIEYMQGCYP